MPFDGTEIFTESSIHDNEISRKFQKKCKQKDMSFVSDVKRKEDKRSAICAHVPAPKRPATISFT